MNSEQIRTRYNEVLARQEELLEVSETRDWTPEENTEFDNLNTEITDLTAKMEMENKRDAAKRNIANNKFNRQPKKTEEGKVAEKFSLNRALINLVNGVRPDQMEGAEGEMHQEAVREAKEAGRSVFGYGLPAFQLRAQTAATAATAGNLIATELSDEFIPALRPNLVLSQLGVSTMNGLVGNVDIPGGDAIATATWEGENDEAANTDPSTRIVELRPNRLAAVTTLSKQLIAQSSIDSERWVIKEINNAISRAVDTAGISGNAGNILGVLGTVGVSDIAVAGNMTRDKLIEIMNKLSVENYNGQNFGWLMNPVLRGYLMSTLLDAGSGKFLMEANNSLLGYNAVVSNLVSKEIDTDKTALIYGDWSQMVVANWGGVDLTVDAITAAKTAQVVITVNSYWDVKVKQPKAFAFANDVEY